MKAIRAGLLTLATLAWPARALDLVAVSTTISGNDLSAKIQLPSSLAADLSIVFEQVVGLNVSSLAVSAGVLSALDLPSISSRLPGSVSVPTGFPVLVRIEPTAASALSFAGVYRLTLRTHNLVYASPSPFRLYRSSGGGPFIDMTGTLEMGSVRAGGSGPGFSEFLIVADVRPVDAVITEKLTALESAYSANASSMSAEAAADVSSRLGQIRGFIESGSWTSAIDALAAFGTAVKSQSGAAIPDVWRANASLVNVAGALRSAADTLRFSLLVKSNSGG